MAPRILTFLVLCAMALFLAHREKGRANGKIFDDLHLGWLHANSHVEHRTSKVLLVALEDGDAPPAERIFQSWPLSELDYALLLDNLFQSHPRAVAIEPVLAWPADAAPFIDSLAQRLKNAPPPLLLGSLAEFSELSPEPSSEDKFTTTLNRHVRFESVSGNLDAIPPITQFLGVPAEHVAGTTPLAVTHIDLGDNIDTRGEGTVRVPLLARVGENVVATFPLAALLLHRNMSADQIDIKLGQQISGPNLLIPIDVAGRYSLDLESRQDLPTINARLFALSVSSGAVSADTSKAAERIISGLIKSDTDYEKLKSLTTHLAVVGQNDRGAHRFTIGKGDESLSRAEVFCQTIAAMDIGQKLVKAPSWSDYTIGGGTLLAMLILLRHRRGAVLRFSILSALLLAMASLLAFQQWHLWFPVFSAMVVIACAALAAVLVPINKHTVE